MSLYNVSAETFSVEYLETLAVALATHEHVERLDTGLSNSEVDAIQRRFGFTFPPDLQAVLQFALPTGKAFPDWRNGAEENLRLRLGSPLDGIVFDIEHNDIWAPDWGPKPIDEPMRWRPWASSSKPLPGSPLSADIVTFRLNRTKAEIQSSLFTRQTSFGMAMI